MNNTKEMNLVNSMTSLNKTEYQRDELIEELLKFQDEIVRIAYNKNSNDEKLDIFDVEKYLAQRNDDLGNPADEELRTFMNDSFGFENYLKKEISGISGENKVFAALKGLNSKDIVLTNVEMTDGERTTELDAVVINPKGITIVEVKNTKRDIYIDKNGRYYRTGEFLKLDSNLGEKMKFRESLIKSVLAKIGFPDVPVRSLLVFNNSRIQVQNKCRWIHTCFTANLVSAIDDTRGKVVLGETSIECIERAIVMNRTMKAYPLELEADQMKMDFAKLIIKLQEASERPEPIWKKVFSFIRKPFVPNAAGYLRNAA